MPHSACSHRNSAVIWWCGRGVRRSCQRARRRRRPRTCARIRRRCSSRPCIRTHTRTHTRNRRSRRQHHRHQGCSRGCRPSARSRRCLRRRLRPCVHNRLRSYSRSRRCRWFRWFRRRYNLPLHRPLGPATSRGSVEVDSPLPSSITCWAGTETTTAASTAIVGSIISLKKRTWRNSPEHAHAAQSQAIGEGLSHFEALTREIAMVSELLLLGLGLRT